MDEKRHTLRHRTLKGARIAFQHARAVIQCVVRNLPEAGASLAVDSPLGIPDTFHLMFDDAAENRQCKVIWRSKDRLGVQFL